jgi:hypothetical protein
MDTRTTRRDAAVKLSLAAALCAGAVLVAQCSSDAPRSAVGADGLADWAVVYRVLQHPRCVNCHPVGGRPLQGEGSVQHPQGVVRGTDGTGVSAMRCDTCHGTENAPGEHMPPGAPHWKLPPPQMPLVFEGRSSGDLCRQLRDLARNGHRTPEQVLEHLASDPLVLWGWNPGEGRAPVDVPHDELVRAARAWIAGGCNCPE